MERPEKMSKSRCHRSGCTQTILTFGGGREVGIRISKVSGYGGIRGLNFGLHRVHGRPTAKQYELSLHTVWLQTWSLFLSDLGLVLSACF